MILIYAFFTLPFLIFLIDKTQNPFSVQEVLIVLIATLIGFSWFTKKEFKIKKFILPEKFLFAFWLITFLSWLMAFYKFPDWKIAVFFEGYRALILVIFNAIFVYFLRKITKINLWPIIFTIAFLVSVYGILQFFGVELIWPIRLNPFGNRCISTFGNPNFLASFLVLLIPIGFYFSQQKQKLYLISTITMIFALGCTMTRSAWLGLLMVSLFFIKKYFKLFCVFFVLFSIFIFATPLKNDLHKKLQETFTLAPTNQTIHQRILIWKASCDMFKNNPIIGVGWGFFESNFPFYQAKYLQTKPYDRYRTHANNCHNEILEILTQTGILGFICYFGFFLLLFIYFLKFLKNPKIKTDKKLFAKSLFAGIAAVLIDNLLNVSLHFTLPSVMFWFVVSSFVNEIAPDEEISIKNYRVIPIFFAIICIFQVRFLWAEIEHFNGLKNKKTPLIARKHFQNSKKLQKYSVNNLYELGNVSVKLGLIDDAIKNYQDAILANPSYDEAHFNVGLLYLKQNKISAAKKELEISYKINPINIQTILSLFNISFEEKYLQEALKLEPKNYIVINNLGVVYSLKGDFAKAISYYEQAPNYDIARQNLDLAKNKKSGIFVPINFELS